MTLDESMTISFAISDIGKQVILRAVYIQAK
jgi:hypothetical protein